MTINNTFLSESNLSEILKLIYPKVKFEENKSIPKDIFNDRNKRNVKFRQFRPDYRSEELSIIVEFDGVSHYQDSTIIWNDIDRRNYYESLGYKFIQIPYFVQLSSEEIKHYFGVDVSVIRPKSGFHMVKGKLNPNNPSSYSELGISRFLKEYDELPLSSQMQIKRSLEKQIDFIDNMTERVIPFRVAMTLKIGLNDSYIDFIVRMGIVI